jgi:hypothetical protein
MTSAETAREGIDNHMEMLKGDYDSQVEKNEHQKYIKTLKSF